MPDGQQPLRVRFGDYELDEARNELRRGGSRVELQPKPLQLLLYLVRERDRFVPKDELLETLWLDAIVTDASLANALSQVRQALGDDGTTQRVIRTLKGHGYRFVRDIQELPTTARSEYTAEASSAPIRSLAVLPLENLSGRPEQEYVADGMTEALIGELAKLRSLNVISRTSVMRYKQSDKSLPEIARDLGVEGVIEGTVILEADRVRVTTQLIDARSDTHIWSGRYDRELEGVLALYADLARVVAEQIALELTPEEQTALTAPRPVNPPAYDAYLRGLQLKGPVNLGADWVSEARAQFERAVELDPDFAEAWAMLASVYDAHALGSPRDPTALQKARKAAERALALDDHLGQAHAALGFIRRHYDWDFAGARCAFERGLQVSPNDPFVLNGYAWSLLWDGRTEEALSVSARLLRVAPLDLTWRSQRVKLFYFARRYERALEEADRVRELDADFIDDSEAPAHFMLGRFEEAHRAWMGSGRQREVRERGWTKGGWEGSVRAWLEAAKMDDHSPFAIAALHTLLGESDDAFAWLERAYCEREPIMVVHLPISPLLDPLRLDPRFRDLLRRIGLPESWRESS
ncbi:MAG: winged helix-turn-helix domain-containing protein [Myxococcota bacterium]